jgi:phosphatidylglycerophosphatase A
LEKREIQHAILVGTELDMLAEKNMLSEPLLSLVRSDEGLFGCDETLALGSVFGYGSIAVTTFGHLDKHKIGIIRQLDTKKYGDKGRVHTFTDDLVASIAASASSRLAHRLRDEEEEAEAAAQNKRNAQ